MEKLRKEMEEEYIKNGLTKRAIELSQKLDKLILQEQIKMNRGVSHGTVA